MFLVRERGEERSGQPQRIVTFNGIAPRKGEIVLAASCPESEGVRVRKGVARGVVFQASTRAREGRV